MQKTSPGVVTPSSGFVWGVWAIMLLFALGFVAVYGCNVPQWDDWDVLPWLVGERPVTWGWLWATHNEHRIVVPKLLLLALAWVSNCDLRAGMLFNVVALAGASAALMLAVRHRRGFTTVADVVFPLALLHVGQQQNLLWGFQVGFVAGAVLVSLLLALLVWGREGVGGWELALVGLGVLLLPLCGANTLAFAPALVSWLGYAGLVRWRERGLMAAAPALLGAGLTVGLIAMYFLGWQGPQRAATPGPWRALQVAGQFLSTAPGPIGSSAWPHKAFLVAAVSAGTAVLLTLAAWRGPDRVRALGLLALLCGFALLAAGIGWGRGHMRTEGAGLANRYVTLLAPLVCLLYCAWELYLPPLRGRLAQVSLLGLLLLLLIPNTLNGRAQAHEQWVAFEAVRQDIRAGLAPRELARRHHILAPPISEDVATEGLELLQQRRLGPYSGAETPGGTQGP